MKLHWSVLQKELISQILPHIISTYPAHCTVLQYAWHSQVMPIFLTSSLPSPASSFLTPLPSSPSQVSSSAVVILLSSFNIFLPPFLPLSSLPPFLPSPPSPLCVECIPSDPESNGASDVRLVHAGRGA